VNLKDNPNIKPLEGWISLKEAAEELGVTRQYMFRLASNGGLETVRSIGGQTMFVVSTEEIARLKTARNSEEVPDSSVDN
jgi:excisionase family DNA binding protein